ncbi:hypothetical protein [Streptomyces bauhiniae]|uniref:hypothetical protein n=1 Tax=Streptomyces bauhiniae TaxID=2340725 RepID=UPI0036606D1C
MGTTSVEPAAAKRPQYAKRVAQAAEVGLASVIVSPLTTGLVLDFSTCRNAPDYGCLGFVVLWSYAVPLLNFLLAWPALRLLGIRPAWLAALGFTWVGNTVTAIQARTVPVSDTVLRKLAVTMRAYTVVLHRWLICFSYLAAAGNDCADIVFRTCG